MAGRRRPGPAHRHPRPALAWPRRASGTPGGRPGMRACRALGLGWGSRRSRRSPTLGLSRPALLGGSLPPPPPPPHPAPSCSLLRTMWPRRCLASGPAAACGPRSSELPPGLGTAQPGLGAPILPSICSVPKCNPSYQRSRPESVSPAPSPYRGPPWPTPPAKYRTFLREQMSDRQAHGQTQPLALTHAR